jgi:lysophospholipase L1-like esterase
VRILGQVVEGLKEGIHPDMDGNKCSARPNRSRSLGHILTENSKKISKIGKLVKDAWLIVGITILLLCLLEASFSLVFFIKDRFRASDLSTNVYNLADTHAESTMVKKYLEEFHQTLNVQWRPYVYWRRKPYHGNYINIDTNGIRLTALTKPLPHKSHTPVKIFMFGGSTLWGQGARDAFTIPSIFAQELRNKNVTAEVINFGESGYVSTQEVITLLLQLQKGQVPDFVIFFDGINDMYSAYQHRMAGTPQNEYNRVKEFNLSHPYKLKQRAAMILLDAANRASTVRFTKGVLRKTGILRDTAFAENRLPFDNQVSRSDGTLARDVLAVYRGNIEIVKALSEHYHFKYLFYWQPTIFQKVYLTEYERASQAKYLFIEQFFRRTYEVIRQSGLAGNPEYLFHDLCPMFAEVTEPVFVDWCHLSESGNTTIAKKMASDVLGLITVDESVAGQGAAPDSDSAVFHRRK